MATFTSFLGLRKPATSDNVNVTLDISDNMEDIDVAIDGLDTRLDLLDGTSVTSFTPSVTSTGTSPDDGAGSTTGHYFRHGKVVHAYYNIVCGAGASAGTGTYRFNVPTGLTIANSVSQGYNLGRGSYQDAGADLHDILLTKGDSNNYFWMYSVGEGVPGSAFNAALGQYVAGRQYVFTVVYPID